jgi:hypothetical protein
MDKSGWTGLSIVVAAAIALLAPSAASAAVVAQWSFDEGGGQSVFDDGPFGLTGRLGATDGPDAADPAWIPGGGLRFDGRSYVALPATPRLQLQHMTVGAVVRASSSPGAYRYVLSRGGSRCWAGSYGLYSARTGGIAFYVFDGEHYVVSATARAADVWDGAWHNVAGTFDGSSLRLFVDGRPVGDPMPAPLTVDYSTTSDAAAIGQYVGACDLAFRGDLDLVRVENDAVANPGGDALAGPDPAPPAPLTPAEPGTVLSPPAEDAPPRTAKCTLSVSRSKLTAGRRTVVRAIAKKGVTVTARRTGGKRLAKARADARGSARLSIRAPRSGRVTISATGCGSVRLRVVEH